MRAMTLVLWCWTIAFAGWITGVIIDASNSPAPAECVQSAGQKLCDDAGDVGTGMGVAVILFVWFVGFLILSLIWFMVRLKD